MKKRLSDVFSFDEPSEFMNTMTFSDQESANDFFKKLHLMQETGEIQSIEGVSSILTEQKINGYSFPYSKHDHVARIVISPLSEEVPIQVITEYGEYRWEFQRIRTKTGAILQAIGSGVVRVKVTLNQEEHQVTLSYTVKPQDANTMDDIAHACSATVALLKKFYRSDAIQNDDTISTSIKNLEAMNVYYNMIMKLEEKLNKRFSPASIKDSETEAESVYELYFMLVQGMALRQNCKVTGFSVDYSNLSVHDKIPSGTPLTFSYLAAADYDLFGESFPVYISCVAFNLVLESILDDKEKQRFIIKMKDLDSAPGYISYKGFFDEFQREQEAERIKKSFFEVVKEYKDSKSWSELIESEFDY